MATVAYVIAGYIGRSTLLEHAGTSLIWPAIGVGALWLGSGNRRTWPWDAAVLALATVFVNVTTGAALLPVVLFAASNLAQIFVFILLLRRWVGDLWGFGGAHPLHRLADLGMLVLAGGASCVTGLVFTVPISLATRGQLDPSALAVLWGRNVVALVVISVMGAVFGPPLLESGGPKALARRIGAALRPPSFGRVVETVALVGSSVALVSLIFGPTGQPLAFLLLGTSVWAGLRYSPVVVTLLGATIGGLGIQLTLNGTGPFIDMASLQGRALAAQAFVMMTVLTGLALTLGRGERDAAIKQAAAAERSAADRARLLDAVLTSMTEGVVVTQRGGTVVVRNPASRTLIGLEKDTRGVILDASEYSLFHANGLPLLNHEVPGFRALSGEVVDGEDFHVRSPHVPHGRIVRISARPLAQEDPDAPPRALVHLRDVTAERQHSDALVSFAGVVAHDLSNPLSVMTGWIELLEDKFEEGAVTPAVGMPIVSRLHNAAAHMRLLISDLMSYTVARDGSLRPRSVDLTAMLNSLSGLHADRPGPPTIAVDDGLTVWGDPAMLRQVFDNLFGNAVKYVAPGVRPTVAVTGRTDGDWMTIRVTDNGIGIPESAREEIFNPFHRAHQETYQGTGLGLAICQRVVERHGGTIRVSDAPSGIGSTFTLRLPTSPEPLAPQSGSGAGEQQAEDDDVMGYPFST